MVARSLARDLFERRYLTWDRLQIHNEHVVVQAHVLPRHSPDAATHRPIAEPQDTSDASGVNSGRRSITRLTDRLRQACSDVR
jgi:hypothetical protein